MSSMMPCYVYSAGNIRKKNMTRRHWLPGKRQFFEAKIRANLQSVENRNLVFFSLFLVWVREFFPLVWGGKFVEHIGPVMCTHIQSIFRGQDSASFRSLERGWNFPGSGRTLFVMATCHHIRCMWWGLMNPKVELVRVNKLTNLSAFVVGNYAALSVQLVSYWWGFLLAHDTHSNLIDFGLF